jgi:hypothetical protein
VTLQVYNDGSLRVFDRKGDYQLSLAHELQDCGWSDNDIGNLIEDLRYHEQALHVSERKPGVQRGVIWQSRDSNEKRIGDSTPFETGTDESVVESLTKLYQKIDAMPDMIPVVLHRYLGGKTPMLILAQMEGQMIKMQDDQMRMHGELSDLKQLNGLNHLSAPSLNTADGPPSLGATEPLSKGSPESAGTLSLHSPPAFLDNNKSQQAIQLSVTKAPDTGEPFCEKASPKIGAGDDVSNRRVNDGLIAEDHDRRKSTSDAPKDPTVNEQLALDLGLVFKEGYARTAGVEPLTESAAASSEPQSKRCPKCREYGLGMIYCGDIMVFDRGETLINPFRCFKDFVNCIRYQNGGQSGGYSDLVAAKGNEIKRSMGYPTKRMGVGP